MTVSMFLFGLLFGSFFNVLIYRIPRHISIVSPRSHCPKCSHNLSAFDLIPVLSYVVTLGRCRYCKDRISPRYILIELLTGIMFAAIWQVTQDLKLWAVWSMFFSILLVLSFIDWEHMILPNMMTVGGLILGLALSFTELTIPWDSAGLGAAIGVGIILLVVFLSRGGMGIGDAKLLGMIGAFLGPWGAAGALFWGSVFGTVVGLTLILGGKQGRQQPIPFGPFMSLGAVVMWLSQDFWLRLIFGN